MRPIMFGAASAQRISIIVLGVEKYNPPAPTPKIVFLRL